MEQENISVRLDKIEKAIEELREKVVDSDVTLTNEEKVLLDESVENEKEGRLTSSQDLKKELGI